MAATVDLSSSTPRYGWLPVALGLEENPEQHTTEANPDSLLIVSPYTSAPHLLDLKEYDQATQLFARALTIFKPMRDDYATADYVKSFNFEKTISFLRQLTQATSHPWRRREFYVVSFRSRLKPDADSTRLFDLDAFSHQEAMASGGLLKYWYGVKDASLQNLATCK